MNLLKKEFIYAGHLLSLGATSIVWTVAILLNKDLSFPVILLPYLCSQIVYNYDHIFDADSSNSSRSKYLNSTKQFQNFMMIIYSFMFLVLIFKVELVASGAAILIVSGGVLYTSKFKGKMKRIVGLKNIYIALFWSALAFFVYEQIFAFWLVTLFIFVRWIINSSFFDIKDIESDKNKNIATLPVVLGLEKTIFYLHLVNIFSGLVIIYSVAAGQIDQYALSLLFFVIYSFYYLGKASSIDRKGLLKMSYILVDGEYLLWPFMLVLGKMFVR